MNRIIIYKLKRLYGGVVDFYVLIQNDNNILTGKVTRAYDIIKIKKAIILPKTLQRKFIYDLAYIASAKNFTGGGYFDEVDRFVVIDARDLPKGFQPKIKYHLQFEDARFEIKTVENIANDIFVIGVVSLSSAELS